MSESIQPSTTFTVLHWRQMSMFTGMALDKRQVFTTFWQNLTNLSYTFVTKAFAHIIRVKSGQQECTQHTTFHNEKCKNVFVKKLFEWQGKSLARTHVAHNTQPTKLKCYSITFPEDFFYHKMPH